MSLGLEQLTPCFQGIVPAMFFTCAKDGTPNAAFLSHVDYVDPTHVALSFQFFNKSRRNIAENPQALIRVIDPDTNQGWALRLKFERSEDLRADLRSHVPPHRSDRVVRGAQRHLQAEGRRHLSGGIGRARCRKKTGVKERWSPRGRAASRIAVFTMKALQELSARMTTADQPRISCSNRSFPASRSISASATR